MFGLTLACLYFLLLRVWRLGKREELIYKIMTLHFSGISEDSVSKFVMPLQY